MYLQITCRRQHERMFDYISKPATVRRQYSAKDHNKALPL